jgi:hypothetical protein
LKKRVRKRFILKGKGLGKKGETVCFKKGQVGFLVVFEEKRLKKGQQVCILLFVRKIGFKTWEGVLVREDVQACYNS